MLTSCEFKIFTKFPFQINIPAIKTASTHKKNNMYKTFKMINPAKNDRILFDNGESSKTIKTLYE